MRDLPWIGEGWRIGAAFLTAAMLTGCQTAAKVDHALYTVANSVSEQDRVTGKRTLNLVRRPKQISKANGEIEKQISQWRKSGINFNADVDPHSYARLSRILGRIHAVSHFSKENWKILLVPDQSFNASVNGGTYVKVHLGLLRELQSDDEIAAILGHEIGHVAANHRFERSAQQKVLGLAKSRSAKRQGYTEAFGLLQEEEADRIGVLYAALAGYDPIAASRIWERFAQKHPRQWPFFRTHPAEPERSARTRRVAAEVAQYYRPNIRNAQHEKILACNKLWCRSDKKSQPGKGAGFAALLGTAVDVYGKHLLARAERQRQQAEIKRERIALAARGYRRGILAMRMRGQNAVSGDVTGPVPGRIYRGQLTNAPVNQSFGVKTRFTLRKSGQLMGRYVYRQGYRKRSGRMLAVGNNPNGGLIFSWQAGLTKGWALFQFQPDGNTFDGQWGYAGKSVASGIWSGKIAQ